ncbi:MAG: hypothetical protein WCD89_22755 [Anaerocolumna sp.]
MELITNNLVTILGVIGMLAFLVSVITEVTKGVGFLKKIPTDIQVIVLSVFLCVFAYFAYATYAGLTVAWYLVIGAVIGAFIVAFVAMYGWDKLNVLYNRFTNTETEEE